MKLPSSLLLMALLIFFSCKKEEADEPSTTIDENIEINSSSLNFYKEELIGITTINGDVEINDINFLYPSFMSDVETITGDLIIRNNVSMESLEGLEKLKSVRSLKIFSNNVLANLEAIRELKISQDLVIGNTKVADIPELDIEVLTGEVNVYSNSNLISFSFLENLTSADKFTIKDNETLPNLDGVEKLTQIAGQINISNNIKLNSLEGMNNLGSCSSSIIFSNLKLSTLDALANLTQVTDQLQVTNNYNLISIEGIQNLTDCAAVKFTLNATLENLCPLKPFIEANPSTTIEIFGNAENPTVQDILDDCP
jgi:hypothetical protein